MFVKLSPYLIALLVGFLIGVERERKSLTTTSALGVRSFLVIAMGGALAGGINQPLIALGLLIFCAALIVAGYIQSTHKTSTQKPSVGITTELAGMAVFGLAYSAHSEPFLSLALAIVLLLFLHNKPGLQNFIKGHLTLAEIQGAGVLLLLAVGVLPLLPNKTIDPFDLFNPFILGLIISLLAGMQFMGYAAAKVFGHHIGIPLSGFFAGIISSTGAYVTYARQAHAQPGLAMHYLSAAAFAIAATLSKLFLVVGAVSPHLAIALIIPVSCIIIASAACGLLWMRHQKRVAHTKEEKNPLSLWQAIKFGLVLMGFITLVTLAQRYLNQTFTQVIIFLGGLFELDSVVIASASLLEKKSVSLHYAAASAMNAIIASLISKLFITIFLAKDLYRKQCVWFIVGLLLLSSVMLALVLLMPGILLIS